MHFGIKKHLVKIIAKEKKPLQATAQKVTKLTYEQKIAMKAGRMPFFIKACREKGFSDPENVFLKCFKKLRENQKILEKEFAEEERIENAGGKFDQTKFYAIEISKRLAQKKQ